MARESGRSRQAKDSKPVPSPGLAAAVENYITGLRIDPEDAGRLARAALARSLAAQLEAGAGMAAAAVSKELRATFAELEGGAGDEDGDAFTEWERQLGSPS